MAQALAEQSQPWAAEQWPPKGVLSSTPSFEVEGTVVRSYPLNVRRSKEQQGYLKQAVSADVNVKFRALELQVSSLKNLQTGAAVPLADLSSAFAPFVTLVLGSAPLSAAAPAAAQHLKCSNGVLTVWADFAIATALNADRDAGPIELVGAQIRCTTEGSTMMVHAVSVMKTAKENKKVESLESQPNLFAKAAAGYNPAAAASTSAAAKPAAAAKSKKDDDDWDD